MYTYIKTESNGKLLGVSVSDMDSPIIGYIAVEPPTEIRIDPINQYYYDFNSQRLIAIPSPPGPDYVFNYDTKEWELATTPESKMRELNNAYNASISTATVNGFIFKNTDALRALLAYTLVDNAPNIDLFTAQDVFVNLNKNRARELLEKLTKSLYYNAYNYKFILAEITNATTQAQLDAIDVNSGWYT